MIDYPVPKRMAPRQRPGVLSYVLKTTNVIMVNQ